MDKPKLTFAEGAKLPQFDMPIDFIVYDDIRSNLLKFYASFPCKIDACVICFVESGELVATINLRDYNIKSGDLVMLLPGSFIQVNEVSDDTKIAFAGFSAGFASGLATGFAAGLTSTGLEEIVVGGAFTGFAAGGSSGSSDGNPGASIFAAWRSLSK